MIGSRKRRAKPGKPYPEFPLYAHAGGVWAKRIRGREVYFGPWGDPMAALDRYLKQRDHLLAGLPPPQDGLCALDELVNRFIAAQGSKRDSGEITPRQLADYTRDGKRILDCLGRARPVQSLGTEDFARLRAAAMTGPRGPRNATTATNIIIRQRSIFKWGHTSRLLAAAVEFGGALSVPPARIRRRALRAAGPRDMAAPEIRALLKAAEGRDELAMILLGINAGLGNTDCSMLERSHVDLDAGLLDYRRPKTDARRRSLLWPATVKALRAVLARRDRLGPIPAPLADRIFLTPARSACVRVSPSGGVVDAISVAFSALAKRCGVHRAGIGFYALRHSCQTVADETRDFPAVDLIMGHVPADADMAARYRQRIGDERLAAVAEHVRKWLGI